MVKAQLLWVGICVIAACAIAGAAMSGGTEPMLLSAVLAAIFYLFGTLAGTGSYRTDEQIHLGSLVISVLASFAGSMHVLARPHELENEELFAALPAMLGEPALSEEAAGAWAGVSWAALPVMLGFFGLQIFYIRAQERRRIHERWSWEDESNQQRS